jgi:uncharacterized repeat protein (TIGR03803 family)
LALVLPFVSIILFIPASALAGKVNLVLALTEGKDPVAGLVQGTDGNLYGTTASGGANNHGTVFGVTPSGTITMVYSFCPVTGCADGSAPGSSLVQASDGNFYGTTVSGGANSLGTIFSITPGGVETVLYSFCNLADCSDGDEPVTGLLLAIDGNLYGTTYYGGSHNDGTIFRYNIAAGTLDTLYSFCSQPSCADGIQPQGQLIQGKNGQLYGTTVAFGANGEGTAFRFNPATKRLATLYSFCAQSSCTDGSQPLGGLIQATNGNFYGTTSAGGTYGVGTVFELTASGTETVVYSFSENYDGDPFAALVQGTNGVLYGTTTGGYCGGVFEIVPKSEDEKLLWTFDEGLASRDGCRPTGSLIQHTNGLFYGTTNGVAGKNFPYPNGTVFSLNVGLDPFVKPQPTSGGVGASITVLGTGLTGTTGVSFNGTSAKFTVNSDTEITTTVPSGATTGKLLVETPGGPLSGDVSFIVP